MTKQNLTTHYCIDKKCGFEETSRKIRDGWKCPKCNSHMSTRTPVEHLKQSNDHKQADGFNPGIGMLDESVYGNPDDAN